VNQAWIPAGSETRLATMDHLPESAPSTGRSDLTRISPSLPRKQGAGKKRKVG